jgi:hypothetical protein
MAYQYPYTKVTVQDDVDFVVAAHHNAQETQLFELTEAVKALDDFGDTFPALAGEGGKLVAVKGTEDGYEYIDAPSGGGLLEPGLICFNEPHQLEQYGYGFDSLAPAALVTTRPLTVDENIYMRVIQYDSPVEVIPQPASMNPTYAFGDIFVTEYWFTPTDGLTAPMFYFFPPQMVANVLIYDEVQSAWVDFITVKVQGPAL